MTTMHAAGVLLRANADDRTLTYKLLPYGEEGRTNLGKVKASRGRLTLPADATTLVGNLEHDRKRPAARFASIDETDEGLTATLRMLPTSLGNDLLVEALEGVRTGISVEIDDPVIRGGELLGGTLAGAGLVTEPAFPSAQLVAADAGDLPADANAEVRAALEQALQIITNSTVADPAADTQAAQAAEEDSTMTTATAAAPTAAAPQGLLAQAVNLGTEPEIKDANDLFARIAAAYSSGSGRMIAALDQVIQSDAASTQQPAWAGEIWARRTHRQKYVPLFHRETLTALKVTGWKFTTGKTPQVAAYAGFPAQPNSNEVKAEAVTVDAARVAGAGAVDRAFVDFSAPEFWAGYYRECADDMSRKLDAAALAHMLTSANYTATTASTVPSGVATAISYILDGVLAISDLAVPDFAIVGIDLFRALALTKTQDAVAYLSLALGLDPAEGRLDQFRIVPSGDSGLTGKVLVGASESHTFWGEKQVRVDTVNISTGGVETGLFGYHAENTANAACFALVAPGA